MDNKSNSVYVQDVYVKSAESPYLVSLDDMDSDQLTALSEQVKHSLGTYKERMLDKARQQFFKAVDEVIKAGGSINYYGELECRHKGNTSNPNVYSMDKDYIYVELKK